MEMMKIIFLAILGFVVVQSQLTQNGGSCPSLKSISPFNASRFKGVWYIIKRYPSDYDNNGKCNTIEFTDNSMIWRVKDKTTNETKSVEYKFSIDNPSQGNYRVDFPDSFLFIPTTRTRDVSILDSDLISYAIMAFCDGGLWDHHEYLYVMSRNNVIPLDKIETIRKKIIEVGMSDGDLRPTDQQDC